VKGRKCVNIQEDMLEPNGDWYVQNIGYPAFTDKKT
jgi:hypothetical protein